VQTEIDMDRAERSKRRGGECSGLYLGKMVLDGSQSTQGRTGAV
jgi:hypothetical protein